MVAAEIVEPSAAVALVEQGAVVLDTRGALAWLAGHIPGAVRADWRIGTHGVTSGLLGEPDAVAAAFAALGVDDGKPVLVVGAWTAGWGEEGRVAWDLAWLGHPEVHVLAGGMDAWPGARHHLARPVTPGHFTARPRPELRATRAQIEAGGFLLVDVREPDEFAGATRYGEARGGHIPGARSVPWRTLLAASPDLPRDAALVTYCTGGVRSAMAWLWLVNRGYPHVANYDGSWWEWSRG